MCMCVCVCVQEVVNVVQLTILKPRQYCVAVNALGKDGRPQLGHRELRCGPLSFFLQPGRTEVRLPVWPCVRIGNLQLEKHCLSLLRCVTCMHTHTHTHAHTHTHTHMHTHKHTHTHTHTHTCTHTRMYTLRGVGCKLYYLCHRGSIGVWDQECTVAAV